MRYYHYPRCSKSRQALELLQARGIEPEKNRALLTDLCNTMKFGSLCALGGFTPYPVMSALHHFPEDFAPAPMVEAAE